MAKPTLQIQFASPAPVELMHRVLNFIEDVWRIARNEGIASVSDIERYGAGTFVVQVSAPRHLGEVRAMITKCLKHHRLESKAAVTRVDLTTRSRA